MLEFNSGMLAFLINCFGVLSVPAYLTKIFEQPFLTLLSPSCDITLATTVNAVFPSKLLALSTTVSKHKPCSDYNMESCHMGLQHIGLKKKQQKLWQQKVLQQPHKYLPIPRCLPKAWHSVEKLTKHTAEPKDDDAEKGVSSLAPGERNRVGKVGHAPKEGKTG